MSGISCHVLDTTLGRPAVGISVELDWLSEEIAGGAPGWQALAQAQTNTDGRALGLSRPGELRLGQHRITFHTEAYFRRMGQAVFYPHVQIFFLVAAASESYHIPLLLSPFGFSTYRGS